MNDPIADLVVRIKNANKARIPSVSLSGSNLTTSIIDVLKKEGYIAQYKVVSTNKKKTTVIDLKYKNSIPTINGIKQISKPGLRVYANKEDLPRVLGGLGIAIISTNQGVVTDKKARELAVGGEVLAFVW